MLKYYYLFFMLLPAVTQAQDVSSFAGQNTVQGAANGESGSSSFRFPHGLTADAAGNIYVADRANHLIRKISGGIVSTVAGSGQKGLKNGSALSARFNEPTDVAVDAKGNLYVSDFGNHCIRKISTDGTVSTLAGSGIAGSRDEKGDSATFFFPMSVAYEKTTSTIMVADYGSHIIRKVSAEGLVTTLAGTPNVSGYQDGTSARFAHPCGLAIGKTGQIFVADRDNNCVREIYSDGSVTTYVGLPQRDSLIDGRLPLAGFSQPVDLAFDNKDNLYVVENGDSLKNGSYVYRMRKINVKKGRVALYAGKRKSRGSEDGSGEEAAFNGITGITYINSLKSFYVSDANNQTIRKVKQSRWDYDVTAITDSIFIPSAFTPNGDGNNDKWHVESRFKDSLTFSVQIEVYNQWGQKVFYARKPAEQWDGKTGDAENPTGTYRYVISAWYEDKYATVKGSINLIR